MATAKQKPDLPGFFDAVENGEITERSGYHKVPQNRRFGKSCDCKKMTDKGAYRDVSVMLEDLVIHYYHQHPIVVKWGNFIRVSSCGWKTSTTKERINRYLPGGYRLYQEDYEWYLSTPNGVREFSDGMLLEV